MHACQKADQGIMTPDDAAMAKLFASEALGRAADNAKSFAITGVDETPRGPRKRITAFLVDRGHKGFDVTLGPLAVSQRAYRTYQHPGRLATLITD